MYKEPIVGSHTTSYNDHIHITSHTNSASRSFHLQLSCSYYFTTNKISFSYRSNVSHGQMQVTLSPIWVNEEALLLKVHLSQNTIRAVFLSRRWHEGWKNSCSFWFAFFLNEYHRYLPESFQQPLKEKSKTLTK